MLLAKFKDGKVVPRVYSPEELRRRGRIEKGKTARRSRSRYYATGACEPEAAGYRD